MKHFLLLSFFATLAVHADLVIVEEMLLNGKDYSSQIARADVENPIPEAKATGKTEMIDGKECEIFTHKTSGVSTRCGLPRPIHFMQNTKLHC
jgi:hypothetical protein